MKLKAAFAGFGALVVLFVGTGGCGSSGGEVANVPTADMQGEEVAPAVGVRTYVVLDDRLEAHTFQTPRSYPRAEGKPAPLRMRTGLGMKRSLENRMAHLFRDVAFLRSMRSAAAGLPEKGKAELILWPRLVKAQVLDDEGTTTAEVALTVLVTTGSAAPLERVRVHVKSTAVAQPSPEDDDPDSARLRHALSLAYNRVVGELTERLKRSPSLRAVVDAKTAPMRNRLAVDYAAAVQCAKDQGRSVDEVEVAYGRDDPAVRRAMDRMIAGFGDEEQLGVYLLTCEPEGADVNALLERRLFAVGEQVDAGDFDAAKKLLEPLEARGSSQHLVSAMSRRIARERRKRQEAEDAARLAAEAEAHAKQEAEERRIAEEEAARQAKEEAERQAAEQARRQAEADALGKSARKQLKRKKYDAARDEAMRALQILPNHVEARAVINAIAQHERDVELKRRAAEERKRKQELAKLQAQVPRLIKKCDEMKRKLRKAEEKQREAAVSGNPSKVQRMHDLQQKAARNFYDARAKVSTAIQAYRNQGLGDAADAVWRNARGPCNL